MRVNASIELLHECSAGRNGGGIEWVHGGAFEYLLGDFALIGGFIPACALLLHFRDGGDAVKGDEYGGGGLDAANIFFNLRDYAGNNRGCVVRGNARRGEVVFFDDVVDDGVAVQV